MPGSSPAKRAAATARFAVTGAGARGLDAIGLNGADWQRRSGSGGRCVAYGCLDWSERRDHLAGTLASALLRRALDAGWMQQLATGGRALRSVDAGDQAAGRAWCDLMRVQDEAEYRGSPDLPVGVRQR